LRQRKITSLRTAVQQLANTLTERKFSKCIVNNSMDDFYISRLSQSKDYTTNKETNQTAVIKEQTKLKPFYSSNAIRRK
jgi:hypothetical protein